MGGAGAAFSDHDSPGAFHDSTGHSRLYKHKGRHTPDCLPRRQLPCHSETAGGASKDSEQPEECMAFQHPGQGLSRFWDL